MMKPRGMEDTQKRIRVPGGFKVWYCDYWQNSSLEWLTLNGLPLENG